MIYIGIYRDKDTLSLLDLPAYIKAFLNSIRDKD